MCFLSGCNILKTSNAEATTPVWTATDTCSTRDKFIWLQGREVWLFSMLYNKVEKRQEWLDCAIQGGEFLKKYGHDGNYNWYFSLDRQGNPLVEPYNIFSYTFATMAFGQLSLATGNREYAEIAKKTFDIVLSKVNNPKGK